MESLKKLYSRSYNIGFIDQSIHDFWISPLPTNNIKWLNLKNHKGSWFADPFFICSNDEVIELLVEEYLNGKKGRISLLKIDRKFFSIKEIIPLLELDTHLSFPYIVRKNGEIYVCPENYESGKVTLYKFNIAEKNLEKVCTLINKPLIDVQLFSYQDNHYLCGIMNEQKKEEIYKLYVYKSNSFLGPYSLCQIITNTKNYERGAGEIFEINGKIIRPSQNCDGEYGKQVGCSERCSQISPHY